MCFLFQVLKYFILHAVLFCAMNFSSALIQVTSKTKETEVLPLL